MKTANQVRDQIVVQVCDQVSYQVYYQVVRWEQILVERQVYDQE